MTVTLEDMKRELRTTSPEFDAEILRLMLAAKADLVYAGVLLAPSPHLAILQDMAVTYYVKANFSFDNPDAAYFNQKYIETRAQLLNGGSVVPVLRTF